jgi:hypothetical protein
MEEHKANGAKGALKYCVFYVESVSHGGIQLETDDDET